MTAVARRDPELDLIEDIASFSNDPLGFVMYAFPWGAKGTILADKTGPDDWQVDILNAVSDGLMTPDEAIHVAVASGHGIGKSALVSWILLWSIATHEDTRGVVTANTENQLRTKTWAELAKWHRLCICKHWFRLAGESLSSIQAEHTKTWRIDMVPWSERNTEAFAGLHNQGKRIIVIFDEASAIPDVIWETTEGALTDEDTQILWLVFGNPTRNTGRFRECFGKFRHRWVHRQIDSRTVKITKKKQIQKWINDYGDDSDFVRVRVKGEFPRAGSMQFIGSDLIEASVAYQLAGQNRDALVLGVDVARFGDDMSVIYPRKGRDARTIPPIKFRNVDTMTLASRVAEEARRLRADAVFVDEGGVGAGVVDRLRQLNINVFGIQFGAKADGLSPIDEVEKYANKRAEMYGNLRQAMKAGLAIPEDKELIKDLTAVQYGFNARDEIQLERKEDMKKRGEASPDIADALALTYAYPVMASTLGSGHLGGGTAASGGRLISDFDPFD